MDIGEEEEELTPLKRRRRKDKKLVSCTTAPTKPKPKKQSLLPCSPLGNKKERKLSSSQEATTSSSQENLTSSQERIDKFASSHNKAKSKFFFVKDSPLPVRLLGVCPVCTIDMNFLHGISPRMHINQCLDVQPTFDKGYCSGDSQCSLSNEKHFREFQHESKQQTNETNNEELLESEDVIINGETNEEKLPIPEEEILKPKNEIVAENPERKLSGNGEHSLQNKKLTQTNISSFFGGNKTKIIQDVSTHPLNKKSVKNTTPQQNGGSAIKTAVVEKAKPQRTKKRNQVKKECPFYKKIPGTGFTVDAFRYGEIDGCTSYFLTHFHSDHYGGLTRSFNGKLYCSKITANLVITQLHVDEKNIHVLPMYKKIQVDDAKVVLLDANHCPGSVMFLMYLKNGQRILHVGDFRADVRMFENPYLLPSCIDTLYLDTTYCKPQYTFPPQKEVIEFVVNTSRDHLRENPKTLIICGTYTIGKERVFYSIAHKLGLKIGVTSQKKKILDCLEDEDLEQVITLDYNEAQLHVLPLGAFNPKVIFPMKCANPQKKGTFQNVDVKVQKLHDHLQKYKPRYERVLAFKPTGWTYHASSLKDIKPLRTAEIISYGVPYSEHSSFSELKMFVETLRPRKIIPTVNIGSKESRDQMDGHFESWLGRK